MKSMTFKNAGQIFISGFLVIQIFVAYLAPTVTYAQGAITGGLNTTTPAGTLKDVPMYQGVDQSISQYLCTPENTDLGVPLYNCITKLYRFSVAFGAIALVFFVVLAGYFYLTGGEAAKGKGKSIFLSALTGMAIILGSYVLLSFINPDLIKIKPIQPPIFTASNLPSCEEVGFGVQCVLPGGQVATNGSNGGTPGSASEAQYKALIAKYASANGLEYCQLSALMEQESHFNAIVYSSPDYVIRNVKVSNGPPSYGVTYDTYHAIGLTQVTIYPKNKGGWVGDTPARSDAASFGTSPLTMEMLLNPDTNISAGAHFFGALYKKYGNDINKAYGHYFGSGNTPPVSLTQKYNACKLRG